MRRYLKSFAITIGGGNSLKPESKETLGYILDNGLAVHQEGEYWSISHVGTGYSVGHGYKSRRIATLVAEIVGNLTDAYAESTTPDSFLKAYKREPDWVARYTKQLIYDMQYKYFKLPKETR